MKAIALSTAFVALSALLFADAAEAATQAGVSAAVRGRVDLTPVVEKEVRPIGSGEDVFLGDALKSHEQSGMQPMLLDETSITLGPNADLTVDEFVYDPATGIGEVTASLAEGVFRFVTGKTWQGQAQAMTLKVPFGVIGVRGTVGAVLNQSASSLVLLLGAGVKNNADQRVGALTVTAAGVSVALTRPGFATIIEAGQPPSPPFEISDDQRALVLGPLVPELPPELPPGVRDAAAGATVGQGETMAAQSVHAARGTAGPTAALHGRGDDSTVDPFNPTGFDTFDPRFGGQDDPEVFTDPTLLAGGIGNSVTFISDLPTQTPGGASFAFYEQSGIPLSDGGNYDFSLDIDFQNRNVGGSFSEVRFRNSPTAGTPSLPSCGTNCFTVNLPQQDFDQAILFVQNIPLFQFKTTGIPCGSFCDFTTNALIGDGGFSAQHSFTIERRNNSGVIPVSL